MTGVQTCALPISKVRTVTAEIKKENIASRKAFIKAGYRFSHGVKRAGANADVYKYGGAA